MRGAGIETAPRTARLGIVLVGLLAFGCREPEAPRYRVASRLLDHIPSVAVQRVVVPRCVLSDDRRPAIGCAPERVVEQLQGPSVDPNHTITLPPAFRSRPVLVHASIVRSDEMRTLPPVVLGPPPLIPPSASLSELGVSAPPADAVVRVTARELPLERAMTDVVSVAPGSWLTFAIALDPICRGADVDTVDFSVMTLVDSRARELFHETLAASDPGVATWHERRVPLDAAVAPAVRLQFTTRVVLRAGATKPGIAGLWKGYVAASTAVPLWGEPEILEPVHADEPPNVLLVSLDTLRADGLGTYGSRLATSPHLDAFAAEGVVFERASAPYPATTASHMSMLTGLYPGRHGVFSPTRSLAPGTPTLAAVLAANGWQTAAVTEDGMVAPNAGFPTGFSEYRENPTTAEDRVVRGVETTIGTAVEWLERHARERFFLFVHTYEVHAPYRPPPEFDVFDTWQDGDTTRPIAEAPVFERLRHVYDGEVRYADAQVARLFDALDRLGIAGRTLVVVTADHGEEFGEHGGLSHAHTVYEEVLHVPLLMREPGRLPAGRRIATPVSLVDLMPTILDLVGVESPAGLNGESQLVRMRGAPEDPARMVFAEMEALANDPRGRLIAARTATRKWIFAENLGQVTEAYALDVDPGERTRLTDDDAQAGGLAAVDSYRSRIASAPEAAPASVPLDPALKANLRALGYVN